MSSGYLLDTNIVSDLVRNPQGRVTDRIRAVGEGQVCTSIIVAAELRYGAAKNAVKLTKQLEAVLGALDVLPFEAPADARYGFLRAQLEKGGGMIGGNDLLIAARAITLGLTVVTDNEKEFARIKGLSCENWLREP
jgi:tRNA(fMet)-specific endonuclease VapC